jgi:hypothetical protein
MNQKFTGIIDLSPFHPKTYWTRRSYVRHNDKLNEYISGIIKSQALIFQSIGVIDLPGQIKKLETNKLYDVVRDLEYLSSIDLVYDAKYSEEQESTNAQLSKKIQLKIHEAKKEFEELTTKEKRGKRNILKELKLSHKLDALEGISYLYRCRAVAEKMRSNGYDAYASFWGGWQERKTTVSRQELMQLVINELPLPSSDTAWESIIDFRNNLSSKNRLDWLRLWIAKQGSGKHDINDLLVELSVSINDYKHALEKHIKSTRKCMLATMLKTGIDIFGGNPASAVKNTVDFTLGYNSQLENETDWKGREMAIIVMAQKAFSDKKD